MTHIDIESIANPLVKAACKGEMLLFDGSMGALAIKQRLVTAGQYVDELNITNPQAIQGIHRAYVEAGAQVITTATFNATPEHIAAMHFGEDKGEDAHAITATELFAAAVQNARAAGALAVAADLGPNGSAMAPLGTLTPEAAYESFLAQAQAAAAAQADLILIETITDPAEAKAAIAAACTVGLPVFVTMSYGKRGRTMYGGTLAQQVAFCEEAGVEALGINCSTGPGDMLPFIQELHGLTKLPLIVQPNAGKPRVVGPTGADVAYDITVETFTEQVAALVEAGATIIGGCCGTDPSYIAALKTLMK